MNVTVEKTLLWMWSTTAFRNRFGQSEERRYGVAIRGLGPVWSDSDAHLLRFSEMARRLTKANLSTAGLRRGRSFFCGRMS